MTLFLKIMLLLTLSLSVNTGLTILVSIKQQKELNAAFESKIINNTIQLLSNSLLRDIIENNALKVSNILKTINHNNDMIEFIYVTDMQNKIFAYSFENGFPKYLLNSINVQTNNMDINLINKFKIEDTIVYEYKKVLIEGLDAAIFIGMNRSSFRTILMKNIHDLLIGTVILTLLLMLISFFVSKKISHPLRALTQLLKDNPQNNTIDFSRIQQTTIEIKQLVQTLSFSMNSIIEKEQNLSTTLNSIGDAVIVTDKHSRIVKMNPVAQTLTGYLESEAYLKPMSKIFKIIDASTRKIMFDPSQKVLDDGEAIYLHNHTTLIAKDKTECQIADSAAPIMNAKGETTGVIVVFHDVTEQYKLREKSKNTLEQLERIFQDITTQVTLLELDGTVIVSNNVLNIFTITEETVGEKIWNLKAIKNDIYLRDFIQQIIALASQGKHVQKDIHHQNMWISMNLHPITNTGGEIIQVVLEATDITERKNAQEKIEYQANYDALTGIANRSLAIAQLSQLLKEANRNNTSIAILFLDLDNFKNINDTLGHDTGDKILVEATTQLKHLLREKDIIARLGGDEFLIILDDIAEPFDAQRVCNNIIHSFEKPFVIEQLEIMTTISIGIAMYPADGKDVSELLIHSDIAMYHAKSDGKNTYSFFTQDMNDNIARELQIENKLHHAFDLQEFEVYYQPKVDVHTSKIIGLEALLRWNNKELGFISPEEFIPIAEKSAHIINIGYFVIDEVLKDLLNLKEYLSDDFRISINLSPVQFRDSNLIGKIESSLKQYNISAKSIDFEITETALIYDETQIQQKLLKLQSLGTTISMDDFGTGYASLGYLRSYSFDIIKIDKSFIFNILNSEKDKNLVKAIVAMAKSLELKVVAEGVETKEVLHLLQDMGCEYAQGYFFSKPIPFEDILIMIKKDS